MISTYRLKLKPTKFKKRVIKLSDSTKSSRKESPVVIKKEYSKTGRFGCFFRNRGEFCNTNTAVNKIPILKVSLKRGAAVKQLILNKGKKAATKQTRAAVSHK